MGFPSPCTPSYRALAFPLVGFPPTEHASLSWTHIRTYHFDGIRLSTCDCSPWQTMKRRVPCRQFHRCPPVDSVRVHWGPLVPSFHRLGAFVLRPPPGGYGFPVRRLLCPIRLSLRTLACRWGLPSLLTHAPSHPARSLPYSTWQTQTARDRWRVPLLAPSALCGSPVFGQRGEQGDLCHLCHRRRWSWVPTRSARVGFLARLADSRDKVRQGQRATEGLSHASGDAP